MKDDEAQPNLQTPDTQQMHYYAFRLHTNTKPRRSKEMKKSRVKMFLRCSYILWISILCEAVSGITSDFNTNLVLWWYQRIMLAF